MFRMKKVFGGIVILPVKVEKENVKIVIVDDHPIVRRGIALLLGQEKDLFIAGEAHDTDSAMLVIEKVRPDLALVDVSLRGSSGIELTRKIVERYPETLVLMISMHDESVYMERSLRAGARGFIMKQETPESIISAIRKVLHGEIYINERMKDNMVNTFVLGKTKQVGYPVGSLSDRATEVLQLVGQGFSTRRIANELHVCVKTIESHYASIKYKLGLKNSHELISYAVKWSYAV